jgi:hypothetical protein
MAWRHDRRVWRAGSLSSTSISSGNCATAAPAAGACALLRRGPAACACRQLAQGLIAGLQAVMRPACQASCCARAGGKHLDAAQHGHARRHLAHRHADA